MGLRNVFTSDSHGEQTGYHAIEIPASGAEIIQGIVDSYPREAIVVRPHKDNNGISGMEEVLESLWIKDTHRKRLSRTVENTAAAHAFELRYANDRSRGGDNIVTMQYLAGSDERDTVLNQQLTHNYHDSLIDRQEPKFLPVHEGQYVAGTTLALRRYTLYPIRSVMLDGFTTDPTGSIIQQMTGMGSAQTGQPDANVIVQVMFKPALRDWTDGIENGQGLVTDAQQEISADSTPIEGTPSVADMVRDLKNPSYEKHRYKYFKWKTEYLEHKPTKRDMQVADMLDKQDGKAWRLYFRIFAVSDDPGVAIDRASKTAGMFRNYYEYRGEQTFIPQPFSRSEIVEQFQAGAGRKWQDDGIVKTQGEASGVIGVPKSEHVSTNKMRWALSKPGEGVPVGTPRFDYEKHGVATSSVEEQNLAMLNATGSTVWVGRGVKYGTEAGIDIDQLDTHMLVDGRSGYGKTTFIQVVIKQIIDRIIRNVLKKQLPEKAAQGHGGVINDPKGDDADDFIREWPEDRREEDLIIMDLGTDPNGNEYENIPRFNFLEIPPGVDPNTRMGGSMIESLADSVTGIVADAGGTDNYLGSVMKRVTKSVCRGLLEDGRSASLVDLACAVSSQESLDQFSQWMSQERIQSVRKSAREVDVKSATASVDSDESNPFLQDSVARHAATKTDDKLDPLAGRMDEWLHNRSVRDLICTSDPTFSLYEAVNQGKWLVVRFPEWAGQTERQLLSTSLILGTYFNKRSCPNDDPYWMVCDEFDKIITKNSNLHRILSMARSQNYRCIMACQAPGNQFPKDHPVRDAISDNVDTHISFHAGSDTNSKWVSKHHTVTADTVGDMDHFQFYMRAKTDDGTTDSFLVKGFDKPQNIREQVSDKESRTDEEVEALKLRSMERNGAPAKSAEEQHREARFHGDSPTLNEDVQDDTHREIIETLTCKASYDEVVHETKEQHLDYLIDVAEEPDLFDTWVEAGQEAENEDDEPTGVYKRVLRYLRDVAPRAAEQFHTGVFTSIVESLSELEVRVQDEVTQIRCTENAPTRFKGTGESRSSGGLAHGKTLQEAYEPLTRLGLEITIVKQTGGRDVDAIGKIRETLPEHEQIKRNEISQREYQVAREQFKREHPILYALTDGEDVTIEAEKSTSRSPGKTARNLAKAYEKRQKCLFLAAPEKVHRVYNGLTDPPFVRYHEDGRTRLYNVNKIRIGGESPLRENDTRETHWYLEHETDDLVLTDGLDDETELARFDSLDAAISSLNVYPTDTSDVATDRIGKNGDYRYVKAPFDWRKAFGGDVPTAHTDYEILSADNGTLLCLLDGVLGPLRRLHDDERENGEQQPSDNENRTEAAASDEIDRSSDDTVDSDPSNPNYDSLWQ